MLRSWTRTKWLKRFQEHTGLISLLNRAVAEMAESYTVLIKKDMVLSETFSRSKFVTGCVKKNFLYNISGKYVVWHKFIRLNPSLPYCRLDDLSRYVNVSLVYLWLIRFVLSRLVCVFLMVFAIYERWYMLVTWYLLVGMNGATTERKW